MLQDIYITIVFHFSNISSYAKAQVAPLLENGSNGSNSVRHNASNTSSIHKSSGNDSGSGGRSYGGTEVCRRCSKAVYMAERMIGAGAVSVVFLYLFTQ